ncbi:MAG: hypothetical protein LBT59_02845 [Clostridiales bacterium]|jgi:hypothetical protein|nr:hypothetical protein [Clostridiales bacterium]
MKTIYRRVFLLALMAILACALSACKGNAGATAPAAELADSAASAPDLYSEYKNVDWDSKTIKYNFSYVEHWSWGGVNGIDDARYVTDNNKMFLNLYEDGKVVGYYLGNNGIGTGDMSEHFDPENRIRSQFVGYWEEANGTVTLHTFKKNGLNAPTEYVTTTVELPQSGELLFDFYPDKLSDTEKTARAYGLRYDGNVPYKTATEQLDAINEIWDALLE